MQDKKIKVLYIGGSGRSGTTLLLRLLGQLNGFVAVGELWHIWFMGFTQNHLCGCGQPFKHCPFWTEVVTEAFGGFDQINVEEIRALRRSVQSDSHLPRLALPFLRDAAYQKRLESYLHILTRLYVSIQRVSRCRVIVDSSKGPRYALNLNEVPQVELYLAHLVRDSRAVAYSWRRKKFRPEIHWTTEYMARQSEIFSAMEWNITNSMLRWLPSQGIRYSPIRYEDFVVQPRKIIAQISDFLEENVGEPDFFEGDQSVSLGMSHTAMGNPNRFQQGTIKIKPDDTWHTQMPRFYQLLVTTLTWPLLREFGYFDTTLTRGPAAL